MPDQTNSAATADFRAQAVEKFKTYCRRGWLEFRASAALTAHQTVRFARFARDLWRRRLLNQQASAAQVALGQRLHEAKIGDADLRSQLAQLEERLRSVQAAKGSTRPLETEQKGLFLRLAAPLLSQPAPPGAQAAHQTAVSAARELQDQNDRIAAARAALFPPAAADRLRVFAGYAALILVLLISVRFVGNRESGDSSDLTDDKLLVDNQSDKSADETKTDADSGNSRERPQETREPTPEDMQAAEAEFQKAKQLREDAVAIQGRGDQKGYFAKEREALAHFSNAVRLNPQFAQAYVERGKTHDALGETKQSIPDYSRAIKIAPDLALAWAWRAGAYSDLGEDDRAIADAGESIRLNPRIPLSYIARGGAYLNKLMVNEALTDLDRAIEINDEVPAAFETRSRAWLAVEEWKRAYQDASTALRLNPSSSVAYNNRASALMQVERWKEALSDIDAAARLKPDDANIRANRSLILSKLGRHDEALAEADKAFKQEPQNPRAHASRGIALVGLKRSKEAVDALTKALELQPLLAYCHTARGDAYLSQRDNAKALADYNKALEMAPKYAEGHDRRAQYYRSIGDTKQAAADLAQARQIRASW